ncbi:hypothetical protein PPL_01387 [Heterostelium album PN500]|uniref:Rab3 GTPase-activating protein catalytic subunit n=1 Tax=Heterostelium pallidum (strain ATCC 26659 / Pp 5 / PN500) TaxID=670386 RepID=D3AZ47_HETP5|nr:hypothetical protein PPL_01387 [Heterostelium album PN500]EFA85604.1 hypothetical protein PPL_01387 [Heterostelium album PN500]|eukprot:XP_020437711.1 hypothetical protein PPL_01387 [Heterostelium album PN500]
MVKVKRSKNINVNDGHDDRFEIIDFTVASEWEKLISKLESLIKKCRASKQSSSDDSVTYHSHTYQFIYVVPSTSSQLNNAFMNPKNDFEIFPNTSGSTTSRRMHQQENFFHWFGVQEYFVLLALKDTGPEISELSTMLSAFTIALHNENCYIPGFVGFDEKRLENFLGYMFMPIKRNGDDHFIVKLATESISTNTLNAHQNIAESIEKQLKIFYSKLTTEPDDRNWDQFLSLSTISSKYTYIRNDWNENEWRYIDDETPSVQLTASGNTIDNQQQQQQQHKSVSDDSDDEDDIRSPKVLESDLFRWGYPMDPIEQLQLCVMYPPLASIHVLENQLENIQTKSWFIKAVFRKSHGSLFQLSLGIMNVFNTMIESLKSESIYQVLTDYNIKNRYTLSNNSAHMSGDQSSTSLSPQSTSSSLRYSNEQQQLHDNNNNNNNNNNNIQSNSSNPSLIRTVGSLTKSLASSLNAPLIPTEREIDLVLRDLFFEKRDINDPKRFNNIPEDILNAQPLPKSTFVKRAPVDSLFFSFCFVCLNLQSLVGVLVFWSEFVEEIKWHWEHSLPIPRTFNSDQINMNHTLVYQKMQMINYCISRKVKQRRYGKKKEESPKTTYKAQQNEGWDDGDLDLDHIPDPESEVNNNNNNNNSDDDTTPPQQVLKGQYLLYHDREIVIPETQDIGPMTDDMVNEQLEELIQLGDTPEANELRMKKQTPSLLSDMQSFKYANKGCVFEDFVRWHSKRDWIATKEEDSNQSVATPPLDPVVEGIVDEFGIIEGGDVGDDESNGRTRGVGFGRDGYLSSRMTRQNLWRKTWKEAVALPIEEQPPLFDYIKQAERAISYLENIHPSELIHQIISVLLTSILTIFTNEKSTSRLPPEYCLGMNPKYTKPLIDRYFDTMNQLWPTNTPNEIKKSDFEPLFKSIQDIENNVSKLTSLKSKFKHLDRVISQLYTNGFSDVKPNEFQLINDLIFGEYDDATTVKPHAREYITRSYAPRPFRDSQTMPHRMYTCLSQYECRVSTVISEEDQS